MDIKYPADRSAGDQKPTKQPTRATFTAPLGNAAGGRLVFVSTATVVSLVADPNLPALYSATFERVIPGVAAQEGIVTIQYRPTGPLEWLVDRRAAPGAVVLHGSIPWEIEFRRGISELTADLRELRLRSLDLASVSQAGITLPRPAGVAYIHFGGSASNVHIYRPRDVAVQLNLNSSGAGLALDGHCCQSAADGLRWRSADYPDRVDRYEITVSGSVSGLTIATY